MKRALLTTASVVVFALASALSAQTTGTYGGSTGASQSTAEKGTKKEATVTGCIEQSGSEYMLKTKKGNVELETTEDLKPHVGHTVKAHGSWDKAADKSEASGASHEATSGHTESAEHKGMKEHHFKVSSLEMVSEQCAAQSSAK